MGSNSTLYTGWSLKSTLSIQNGVRTSLDKKWLETNIVLYTVLLTPFFSSSFVWGKLFCGSLFFAVKVFAGIIFLPLVKDSQFFTLNFVLSLFENN